MTSSPRRPPTLDRDGDRDLLARFVDERDDAAFERLVHRYLELVTTVCRTIVSDPGRAEDAVQATFVALARRSAHLRDVRSLPAWLCRVAYRAALKAERARARDANRDDALSRHASPAQPSAAQDAEAREASRALIGELDALPERYRRCLVLCYLDGLSREETAKRLGATVASVKASLERGRRLLRSRLVRRGIAPALALSTWGAARGAAQDLAPAAARVAVRATEDAMGTAGRSTTQALLAGARAHAAALAVAAAAIVLALIPVDAGIEPLRVEPIPTAALAAPAASERAERLARRIAETTRDRDGQRQRAAQLRRWIAIKRDHMRNAKTAADRDAYRELAEHFADELTHVEATADQLDADLANLRRTLESLDR